MTELKHVRDAFAITNVIHSAGLITSVITIAERLKAAREEAGLNQPELARAAGVSQGTIGNIESGLRKRPRELLALAEACGVHAKWLQTGTGPRYLNRDLDEAGRDVTLRFAYRCGEVQGGDNGFIEDYPVTPTSSEPDPIPYASHKTDERAYAVTVRGNSMEPTIMAGWDVVASPGRPAEPPDLCVVHFTNGRKALKRLLWARSGMVCLESIKEGHLKITEPSANIVRMDKVISIVPN